MKTNGTPFDSEAGGLNGTTGKDDADWMALRYVLGELNADETEAFEQTLATDLGACERVASATRLATGLYAALEVDIESEITTPKRPAPTAPIATAARSSRRGLWAVVGLSAAVCFLTAGLSFLPLVSDRQERLSSDQSDGGAGSLVAIWTERSAETATDAPIAGAAASDGVNAEEALSFADADDAAGDLGDSVLIADDDYNVPVWMLAAVDNGNSWSSDNSPADIREN
jgi:hypothetical protein